MSELTDNNILKSNAPKYNKVLAIDNMPTLLLGEIFDDSHYCMNLKLTLD